MEGLFLYKNSFLITLILTYLSLFEDLYILLHFWPIKLYDSKHTFIFNIK